MTLNPERPTFTCECCGNIVLENVTPPLCPNCAEAANPYTPWQTVEEARAYSNWLLGPVFD